jgi:hypothetical protein
MTEQETIKRANDLLAQVEKLQDEIDTLLSPIADYAAQSEDPIEIARVMDILPRGFHRSELRTLLRYMETQQ